MDPNFLRSLRLLPTYFACLQIFKTSDCYRERVVLKYRAGRKTHIRVSMRLRSGRGVTRSDRSVDRPGRPHFDSLADLRRARERLFSDRPVVSVVERPVGDRSYGLSETTVRIPVAHPNYRLVLRRAFAKLFDEYGTAGSFDVTVTANVVLRNSVTGRYGIFHGQDYGSVRDMSMIERFKISNIAEVSELPTVFHKQDFEEVFFRNFAESAVTVDSVVNVVYLVRRLLSNYATQKFTVGKKPQLLF